MKRFILMFKKSNIVTQTYFMFLLLFLNACKENSSSSPNPNDASVPKCLLVRAGSSDPKYAGDAHTFDYDTEGKLITHNKMRVEYEGNRIVRMIDVYNVLLFLYENNHLVEVRRGHVSSSGQVDMNPKMGDYNYKFTNDAKGRPLTRTVSSYWGVWTVNEKITFTWSDDDNIKSYLFEQGSAGIRNFTLYDKAHHKYKSLRVSPSSWVTTNFRVITRNNALQYIEGDKTYNVHYTYNSDNYPTSETHTNAKTDIYTYSCK